MFQDKTTFIVFSIFFAAIIGMVVFGVHQINLSNQIDQKCIEQGGVVVPRDRNVFNMCFSKDAVIDIKIGVKEKFVKDNK